MKWTCSWEFPILYISWAYVLHTLIANKRQKPHNTVKLNEPTENFEPSCCSFHRYLSLSMVNDVRWLFSNSIIANHVWSVRNERVRPIRYHHYINRIIVCSKVSLFRSMSWMLLFFFSLFFFKGILLNFLSYSEYILFPLKNLEIYRSMSFDLINELVVFETYVINSLFFLLLSSWLGGWAV